MRPHLILDFSPCSYRPHPCWSGRMWLLVGAKLGFGPPPLGMLALGRHAVAVSLEPLRLVGKSNQHSAS